MGLWGKQQKEKYYAEGSALKTKQNKVKKTKTKTENLPSFEQTPDFNFEK